MPDIPRKLQRTGNRKKELPVQNSVPIYMEPILCNIRVNATRDV